MQTDLTEQLTALINASTDRPDRPHTAHGNHQFYYDCAICSGKAEEIAAALAPGIERLLAEQAERIALAIEEAATQIYYGDRHALHEAVEVVRQFGAEAQAAKA